MPTHLLRLLPAAFVMLAVVSGCDDTECASDQTACGSDCKDNVIINITGNVRLFMAPPGSDAVADVGPLQISYGTQLAEFDEYASATVNADGSFALNSVNVACAGSVPPPLLFMDDPAGGADNFARSAMPAMNSAGQPHTFTNGETRTPPANTARVVTRALMNTMIANLGTTSGLDSTGAIAVTVMTGTAPNFMPLAGAQLSAPERTVQYPQMRSSGTAAQTDGSGLAIITGDLGPLPSGFEVTQPADTYPRIAEAGIPNGAIVLFAAFPM